MFDFRRIALFCLGYRFSRHKMTICSNNFGVSWPPKLLVRNRSKRVVELKYLSQFLKASLLALLFWTYFKQVIIFVEYAVFKC